MRAYKFLNACFGLKSLCERRLKQSRIHELNDPFELRPYDVTDLLSRWAFLKTREDIGKDRGLLCLSKDWSNPVLWAHYGDNHRGLCLGFEIPDQQGGPDDESRSVSYISNPLEFPANFEEMPEDEGLKVMEKVLFTKFEHWTYEQEVRVWAPLQNEENGLHYLEFDEKLRLVEVIMGEKCTLQKSAIMLALGEHAAQVQIIKARAAYGEFKMVKDEG